MPSLPAATAGPTPRGSGSGRRRTPSRGSGIPFDGRALTARAGAVGTGFPRARRRAQMHRSSICLLSCWEPVETLYVGRRSLQDGRFSLWVHSPRERRKPRSEAVQQRFDRVRVAKPRAGANFERCERVAACLDRLLARRGDAIRGLTVVGLTVDQPLSMERLDRGVDAARRGAVAGAEETLQLGHDLVAVL